MIIYAGILDNGDVMGVKMPCYKIKRYIKYNILNTKCLDRPLNK